MAALKILFTAGHNTTNMAYSKYPVQCHKLAFQLFDHKVLTCMFYLSELLR